MLQRSIQSFLEVAWQGCCNVACRTSWKLIEIVVAMQHAERLESYLKRMLQHSTENVFEVTGHGHYNVASMASWKWMLQPSTQNRFEVPCIACYKVAFTASRKLLEMDVTTRHPERLGRYWKRMLQCNIQSVLEETWHGCYNIQVAPKASWKLFEKDCCNVACRTGLKFLALHATK